MIGIKAILLILKIPNRTEILMVEITYFISDYGFGHAARSIAIIRAFLACDLDINIEIHTFFPLELIKRSLSKKSEIKRIKFHKMRNDVGFIWNAKQEKIDNEKTTINVHQWVKNWPSTYLFEKYIFLKNKEISLIVSDIAPQPFLLAKKLDLPSIAISNFTWFDIYQDFCKTEDLQEIWRAYREASLGLMLPFNLENKVFPTILETSLVSRDPTRSRKKICSNLKINPSTPIIYAGTGKSLINPFIEEWKIHPEYDFILGSSSTISAPNIHSIPYNDPEGQDYIAASDLAVLKIGYSSISEAIRAKIPFIAIDFVQSAETKFMRKKIQELNIGECITPQEFFSGKWIDEIPKIMELKENYSSLPERFLKKGEYQCANIILDLLQEII
ncbi:MAG: hypothetical protein EAX89_10715 [Candidatus Lokiarchaeota archaeon]|nr:hypothetical protein [Candidatus Lokiarchaeota archaeon]